MEKEEVGEEWGGERELSSIADIVTLGLFLCQAATLLSLCTVHIRITFIHTACTVQYCLFRIRSGVDCCNFCGGQ